MPRTRKGSAKRSAAKIPKGNDRVEVGDATQTDHVVASMADQTTPESSPAKKQRNKKVAQQQDAPDNTADPPGEQSDVDPGFPSEKKSPDRAKEQESLPEGKDHETEDNAQSTVTSPPEDAAARKNINSQPTRRPKAIFGPAPERVGFYRGFKTFAPDDEAQVRRWDDWITVPSGGGRLPTWIEWLTEDIETFVSEAFPETCSSGSLDDSTLQKLLRFCPHAKVMIEDQRNGRATRLFVAWIWRILCDNLFSPDCVEKWKPGPWEQFATLMRSLQVFVTDEDDEANLFYFRSKYQQARLLYAKFAEHTEPQRLKNIILNEVRPVLDAKDPPAANSDKLVGQIVSGAVRMDLHMVSSTFEVEILMHDPESGKLHGFPPDKNESVMKDFSPPPPWDDTEPKVEMILKPSFREYGIHDFCIGNSERVSNRWVCGLIVPMEVHTDLYPHIRCGMTERDYGKMYRDRQRQWEAAQSQREKELIEKGEADPLRPARLSRERLPITEL